MIKSAYKIRLVVADEESQTMCVHAILSDGRLASDVMHFHLNEWNGVSEEIYPGLLVNLDGGHCKYFAEWGDNDGWRDLFDFPDLPLTTGQLVTRTDLARNGLGNLVYRIDSLVNLLD